MKKTPFEKVKRIRFDVYDYDVEIIVTNDISKSRNLRVSELGSTFRDDRLVLGLHSCKDGSAKSFIFIKKDTTAGTIAHECWHCIHQMFDFVNAELENEIVAYHLSYLVDLVENFKRKK